MVVVIVVYQTYVGISYLFSFQSLKSCISNTLASLLVFLLLLRFLFRLLRILRLQLVNHFNEIREKVIQLGNVLIHAREQPALRFSFAMFLNKSARSFLASAII